MIEWLLTLWTWFDNEVLHHAQHMRGRRLAESHIDSMYCCAVGLMYGDDELEFDAAIELACQVLKADREARERQVARR